MKETREMEMSVKRIDKEGQQEEHSGGNKPAVGQRARSLSRWLQGDI